MIKEKCPRAVGGICSRAFQTKEGEKRILLFLCYKYSIPQILEKVK
jgi:hypothetical protein